MHVISKVLGTRTTGKGEIPVTKLVCLCVFLFSTNWYNLYLLFVVLELKVCYCIGLVNFVCTIDPGIQDSIRIIRLEEQM